MSFRRSSKSLRAQRYWSLRRSHFTPLESQEFSKLTKRYPALHRLIASRSALWANFVQEARSKGWESEARQRYEWNKRVVGFYDRQRVKRKKDKDTGLTVETLTKWVVKKDVHGRKFKVPRISPWEWYDWVFNRLPDELKFDSPRSHRVRQPDVSVDKVMLQRWIADLEKSIERTSDPKLVAQYEAQIRNLRRGTK